MRTILILLTATALLTACSKPAPPSVEEKAVSKAFTMMIVGQTFDQSCNEAKLAKMTAKDKSLVLMMGNQQYLAAWLGGLLHVRYPDETVEAITRRLGAVHDATKKSTEEALKKQGCDSEAGKAAAKAYEFYTKVHPAKVFEMLAKQIEKEGGTITPTEKMNEGVVRHDKGAEPKAESKSETKPEPAQ